jgi:hypothetical protein
MSLAIGSWLYDASSDYSKNSKELNKAMLSAFSVRSNKYENTPKQVLTDFSGRTSADIPNREEKNNTKINVKKAVSRRNIPSDMLWVLK